MILSANALVKAISEREWMKAKEMINENGNIVRKWSVAPSLTGGVAVSEILPIHQACKTEGCTVDFLESLIWAYPESLSIPETGFRRLPLSIAIRSRQSDEVISFLLTQFPDSASKQDILGRVALHYAISNHSSIHIIEELVLVCPSTSFASDNLGWTPVHVAANMARSATMLQVLLKHGSEAVVTATKKGNTPLMCVRMSSGPDKDLIEIILLEELKKFETTAFFQNFREAESKATINETSLSAGVRKLKRSGSFRLVV